MSDIQAKVAARRAELAQQEKERKTRLEAEAQQQKVIRQEERLKAAGDLSTDGLSPVEVKSLLQKQAKTLWTAQENLLVFGCIIGGLFLLPIGGIGVIPVAIGLAMANRLGKKYKKELLDRYPDKFGVTVCET